MALHSGNCIRFSESKVRPMGRNASGVKGITLRNEDDFVIGMVSVENGEKDILVVSEKGYGKRSSVDEYRHTNRGGKGVRTLKITEKTGSLISIKDVDDTGDLMIINKSGITIRIAIADLRVLGRATQGVRLIKLKGDDEIAAVCRIDASEDDEDIERVAIDGEEIIDDGIEEIEEIEEVEEEEIEEADGEINEVNE